MIGFIVAIFIWAGWLFNQPVFPDVNYSFYMMFLIILAVEIPILGIQIALLYRKKVVKMKPKTNKDLGDISEYLQAHENYRNGNYEYETIRKKEDIKIAHQEGKKFVFTEKPGSNKVLIGIGIFFAISGLIISILLITFMNFENLIIFTVTNSIFSGIGAIIAVPNLIKFKRIDKSFIILDQNGILKSSIWGILRAYSWKDVKVKVYTVKTTMRMFGVLKTELPPTMQIHITLPKGGILKIEPDKYDLREYFSLERMTKELKQQPSISRDEKYRLALIANDAKKISFGLFALTFQYFYELNKFGKSSIKLETEKSAEIENEERSMEMKKRRKAEQIICNFLMENKGKAFTTNSLNSRCFELQQLDLEIDEIVRILKSLYSLGKIGMEFNNNEAFYYIR